MAAPLPPLLLLLLLLLRRFSWKAKLTICKIHVKISEKYISFLRKQSFSHRIRFAALLFGGSKKFSTCERIRQRRDVCATQTVCVGGTFICSMPSYKNVASTCCCCCSSCCCLCCCSSVEWMKASTRRRLHADAKSNLECFCPAKWAARCISRLASMRVCVCPVCVRVCVHIKIQLSVLFAHL